MMLRPSTVAVTVLACAACASLPHVQLADAPSAGEPLEVRRSFYEDHRPVAVRLKGPLDRSSPFLILEDGTRVDHAADLLSNVEGDSTTAKAALRAEQADAQVRAWNVAFPVTLGVAIVTMLSSLIPAGFSSATAASPGAAASLDAPAVTAIVLLAAGSAVGFAAIIPATIGMQQQANAAAETGLAFQTYDASLRRRLLLTQQDLRVVDVRIAVSAPNGDILLSPDETGRGP